jgi:hypothetical protein
MTSNTELILKMKELDDRLNKIDNKWTSELVKIKLAITAIGEMVAGIGQQLAEKQGPRIVGPGDPQ